MDIKSILEKKKNKLKEKEKRIDELVNIKQQEVDKYKIELIDKMYTEINNEIEKENRMCKEYGQYCTCNDYMYDEDHEHKKYLIHEKINKMNGIYERVYEDMYCNDCDGCDGYSRRCECGNRRMTWNLDNEDNIYAEAY